jgi:ATP-dependent exoDNAse (exonuclease V) beta subunit
MSANKRGGEQPTNQPPSKRPRMEPKPEPLQTQLKILSQNLLNSLTDLLHYLPDNNSTKTDRETIDTMQRFCRQILDVNVFHQSLAGVFEIEQEIDFLLAHSDQLTSR